MASILSRKKDAPAITRPARLSVPRLIVTKRLYLRAIQEHDKGLVKEALSDPHMYKHYGFRITEPQHLTEQMAWYRSLQEEGSGEWWVIRERNTERAIGALGLYDYAADHLRAEVGYWLLPAAQGKGYMQEACHAILSFCFGELGLHKITAAVEGENLSSTKLLLKMGFEQEAHLRQEEWKDDRWIDVLIFGRLNPDAEPSGLHL